MRVWTSYLFLQDGVLVNRTFLFYFNPSETLLFITSNMNYDSNVIECWHEVWKGSNECTAFVCLKFLKFFTRSCQFLLTFRIYLEFCKLIYQFMIAGNVQRWANNYWLDCGLCKLPPIIQRFRWFLVFWIFSKYKKIFYSTF